MWRAGCIAALALMTPATAAPAVAQPPPGEARAPLDVRLFTRIGQPGQPEAIAVAADRTVYVGTNQQQRGDTAAPSRIFAYSPEGTLEREYVVEGQDLGEPHGIQGLAIDADGVLYALDRAARDRVFTLDPRTGEQRDYAEFRDVPSCGAGGPPGDCSETMADMGAGPNFPAFAPDGTLYVTDIEQALIWRVPRGGGRPEVFFTDARLENVFGPNGIQVTDGGRTLAFVVTAQSPSAGNPTQGRLFRLPIADGRPGELQSVWESRPVDGPDGFALGRSGNAYIALAGSSQLVVVSPAGEELARIPGPASPQPDPPFDAPASAAFDGERLLVTNQSFPAGNPDHWAVFDIFAGEPGEPLHRPRITGGGGTTPIASARLHLTFNHGPRDCAVGRIRATVRGAGITRVTFRLDRRARRVDRAEPFRRIVYRPRRGQRPRRHTVTARVVSQAGARTLTRRVRTCRRR